MAKKEKKQKKPKEEKRKNQKLEDAEIQPKMRNAAPKRFGAWVLVLFMLSMIGFGAFKIVQAPTEAKLEKSIASMREDVQKETIASTKAVTFAEAFAMDYFTSSSTLGEDAETYYDKMSKYFADGVQAEEPLGNVSAVFVGAKKIDVGKDYVNVDVEVRIAKTDTIEENGEKKDSVTYSTHTIRVPIQVDSDGNCAVAATPIYVTDQNDNTKFKSVMNSVSNDVRDASKEEMDKTIKNFFDVYYSGKPSELQYYVTKNYGVVDTVDANVVVKDIETRIQPQDGSWKAECTITIADGDYTQTQHCFLKLVKGDEGRYYIDEMTTM